MAYTVMAYLVPVLCGTGLPRDCLSVWDETGRYIVMADFVMVYIVMALSVWDETGSASLRRGQRSPREA